MANISLDLLTYQTPLLDIKADATFENPDGTTTFELWDCPRSYLMSLVGIDGISILSYNQVPFDLRVLDSIWGDDYTRFMRYEDGVELDTSVMVSQESIRIDELEKAILDGTINELVASCAAANYVKPLVDCGRA